MVNMSGALQLGYLATLLISSMLEIIATQIVRSLQKTAIHYGSSSELIKGNDYWTKAIVRSSLAVSDKFSLADLDFIKLGLLPDMKAFSNLLGLLRELRATTAFAIRSEMVEKLKKDIPSYHIGLAERMADEITEALQPIQNPLDKSIEKGSTVV